MKNHTIRSRNPKGQFVTAPHKCVAANDAQSAQRKSTRVLAPLKEAGPTSNPDGSIVEGPQN
jgi:hypothetical protein